MRKSYSFILAASVVLSGMGMEALANKTDLRAEYNQKAAPFEFSYAFNAFKPEKKKRPITNKAERTEASDIADLQGTWTFIVGDNYFGKDNNFVSVEFEATIDDQNYVTFVNEAYFPIKAKYNPRTHSLSFYKKLVGEADGNFVYQEPFIYDWETGTIKKKSVLAYFNEYERAVVFEDNIGLAWSAYAEKTGKTHKGYYDLLDVTVSYLPMGGEWEEVGDALFTDAWLAPAFNVEAAEATYKVPAERNKADNNIFRLVNPYKYGAMALSNECEKDGYIVIDITDPDHVVFKFADAGYSNKDRRIDNFFVYNYMGSLVLINPFYTPAEVILEFGKDFPASTFEKGVVKFDTSMALPDVRFALQDLANSTRLWRNDEGTPVKSSAEIILPGFETNGLTGVGAVEEDAEFYTPQGLRVSNPEPGQIVIRRQGNEVTKEIFKK